MEGPWTILELAEHAAEALAATGPAAPVARAGPDGVRAQVNGRVRDVPNERLIRWYVTVGLVDPPLSRRGRVARYGRRHLLQLVAVKRRQAAGRSLAEIQAELAGATDEVLAAVARVPDTEPAPESASAASARFWVRQPRQPSQPGPAAERPGQPRSGAAEGPAQPGPAAAERPGLSVHAAAAYGDHPDHGTAITAAGLVHGVRLAPGVMLLLDGADHEPGPDDVTAIVNAARPLLRELAGRGLCAPGPGHVPEAPGRPPDVEQPAEGSRA
jgi:DNA-binding transcriptional MerR regulator